MAATALALVLAGPAGSAFIPHLDHPRIVPNESIGGVHLDMSKAQVRGLWGPGACGLYPRHAARALNQSFCRWGPKDRYKGETILIRFINGKVDGISMSARLRRSDSRVIPGELARRWRTSKGIHLGSPMADVGTAYPGATYNKGEAVRGYDLFAGAGRNRHYTRFSAGIGQSEGRVVGISLQWDACRYGPSGCS